MSWMNMLYKTYQNLDSAHTADLFPICHSTQKAHIEIALDTEGNFQYANFVEDTKEKDSVSPSQTIIPVTESSSSRTSGAAPHALCDKLNYLAINYEAYTGEANDEYFEAYIQNLQKWHDSAYSTPKVDAVYAYISNGTIIDDLVHANLFSLDETGKLTDKWEKATEKNCRLTVGSQKDAFIRFLVLDSGVHPACWEDKQLQNRFIQYYFSTHSANGLCYVTGNPHCYLSVSHPSKIRNTADKAKLISSNDTSNYTYRGRFSKAEDAVGISFEVSQKAHNALKFLIQQQGKSVGSKVFLLWGTKNERTPDVTADSWDLLFGDDETPAEGDVKTDYAERFNAALSGYSCHLRFNKDTELAILCLDAATTGRMSVNFYREYKGLETEELLARIESWHRTCAWLHTYRKKPFYGAPSLRDIASCAFGTEQNEFIKCKEQIEASAAERLLPCITDGAKIPRDMVFSVVRKCMHPQNYRVKRNWEKMLSVACAVYKKYLYDYKGEKITMNVQEGHTLSFTCGRLLATADAIESYALYEKYGKEGKRTTNAMRYFTSFSQNPCRAWKQIHGKLIPYFQQLGPKANYYKRLLSEITALLDENEFANARNLDGKMLLGFYTQRKEIQDRIFGINTKQEDK